MPTTSPNHEFVSADFLHHRRRSLHACCFHVSSVVSGVSKISQVGGGKCGGGQVWGGKCGGGQRGEQA